MPPLDAPGVTGRGDLLDPWSDADPGRGEVGRQAVGQVTSVKEPVLVSARSTVRCSSPLQAGMSSARV
ncbi:hypothetical protein [Nostocoides veronense]|uniref:hypothetical protein n=1 Tax=Nostocoides veronense TaxID=330836 RepID=UPI0031E30C47